MLYDKHVSQPVLKIVEDIDLIGCTTQLHVGNTHGESLNVGSSSPASSRSHSPHLRKPFDLPTWDSAHDGQDNLDDVSLLFTVSDVIDMMTFLTISTTISSCMQ